MSAHMFGCGRGYVSRRVQRIARKHGAVAVNYCEPGCQCGWGCGRECPDGKRHWFECANRGEPFDGETARAVMAEIAEASR